MTNALDPLPLLKHLHEHGVEYIVIGGLAVSAHGHVRPSKDLDIVPNSAHENLARLATALVDAEAVDAEASASSRTRFRCRRRASMIFRREATFAF